MSRARPVITAVVVENRPVAEVAVAYGVHQAWIYKLLARYRAQGEAAFEPRSRRPRTSPTAISDRTVELIIELRRNLTEQGWTPAQTPSPGTCTTTTASVSRPPRSAAT